MSTDLRVEPSLAAPVAVRDSSPTAAAPPSATSAATTSSPSLPNPRLTVAPGLNRVVLEFYNSNGDLTNTIPSQKQLDAYRLAALSGAQESSGQSGN